DILREELDGLGVEVVPFRHGGDEVSAVVSGADRATVEAALTRAQQRISDYVATEGLVELPHSNAGGRPGVGLHWGVARIEPDSPVQDIFERADRQVEANKRASDVDRGTTETTGAVAPTGRSGSVGRGAAGGDSPGSRTRSRLGGR